jgi:D-alanyl-D-alanine carboxypeptidase
VWHLDYSQRGGFAVYLSGTIRDRSGGLAMGAQRSRSRWLAFASVVAALTVAVAGSDQAQARAKSKRDARPRAIHGPSYHPPYAAIVIDDKSGAVRHEVGPDEPRHPASLTRS